MRKTVLFILLSVYFFSTAGTEISVGEKIDRFVEAVRSRYNAPAAVAGVTGGEKTVYLKNFGNCGSSDLFLIGSNSKSFTGYTVLLLEQEGLLNRSDPVSNYLPWFAYRKKADSEKVTVQDLLTQNSGISRMAGVEPIQRHKKPVEQYRKILDKVDPGRPYPYPHEYSNLNYQLLGLIIETVTGQSYGEAVRARVLERFGMEDTYLTLTETGRRGLIGSYQYFLWFPLIKKRVDFHNAEVSSGFISSTAPDMLKYLGGMLNRMKTPGSPESGMFQSVENNGYHYGWGYQKINGEPVFRHDGLNQSFASSMILSPSGGYGIIVLANVYNSPMTIEMANGIRRILEGEVPGKVTMWGFYLRNSLPLFALWMMIGLIRLFIQWLRLGLPMKFSGRVMPNVILLLGISFGLFWIIYIPYRFSAPLPVIIDHEPGSGFGLVVLSLSIALSALLRYFIQNHPESAGSD